jgi:hypothetical protein
MPETVLPLSPCFAATSETLIVARSAFASAAISAEHNRSSARKRILDASSSSREIGGILHTSNASRKRSGVSSLFAVS